MSTKAEKFILKKTYRYGAAKPRRILILEGRIEGISAEEMGAAIKKLISEGKIYVCRFDEFIKKV